MVEVPKNIEKLDKVIDSPTRFDKYFALDASTEPDFPVHLKPSFHKRIKPISGILRKTVRFAGDCYEDLPEYTFSKALQIEFTESRTKTVCTQTPKGKTRYLWKINIIASVLLMLGLLQYFYQPELITKTSILELKKFYVKQDAAFWRRLENVILSVQKYKKPSSLILLYESGNENQVNRIVDKLAQYAVCQLRSCEHKPVLLESHVLKNIAFVNDFKKLVRDYSQSVEDNGVMVVRNIENVPGLSAKAFNIFCNDKEPIVDKSLFIFTLKVDQFYPDDLEYIEHVMKDTWYDLADHEFYVLLSKISNNILRILL